MTGGARSPAAREDTRRDAERTARLNGVPRVRHQSVPPAARRYAQRAAMKLDGRTPWMHQGVTGPSRLLVRVDEFPHYRCRDDPRAYGTEQFETFHAILADAGVPYLLAALPAVAREPLDVAIDDTEPLTDAQAAVLARLPSEGVTVGLHGYDHRTRFAGPRRHSELGGLAPAALRDRLDRGEAVLTALGLARPRVFVPPFNRFDAAQWPLLAERYDVVCGGPESVVEHGLWRTPSWRGDAVYLPAYPPYYGTAQQVLAALDRDEPPGWGPIVLHWGWEVDRGFADLRHLAARLAEHAVGWSEFLASVEASR